MSDQALTKTTTIKEIFSYFFLILGPERCFRVRIVGSLEKCAERITVREGIDIGAARRRVEEVRPPRLLRLRAEMKLPGRAWLQWETREEEGHTRLTQSALFEPDGLFGWAYWFGSYPFHHFIFDGMIDAIVKLAVSGEGRTADRGPNG